MNIEELIPQKDMTLDEAWALIGEACHAYEDKAAKYALIVVKANKASKAWNLALDMAAKEVPLTIYKKKILSHKLEE